MNADPSKSLSSVPWWLVLLPGLLSILVGCVVLASPGSALVVLVRLLGWYWLMKGIFSLTAIFHPQAQASWLADPEQCVGSWRGSSCWIIR